MTADLIHRPDRRAAVLTPIGIVLWWQSRHLGWGLGLAPRASRHGEPGEHADPDNWGHDKLLERKPKNSL